MARKVKLILNLMANMGNAWRVAKDLRPIVAKYGHADWRYGLPDSRRRVGAPGR